MRAAVFALMISVLVCAATGSVMAQPNGSGTRPNGEITDVLTPQGASESDPTVVFVCEHGAAKSVIATAYFNKIAAERGLRARATYRGVNPQADLSISTLKGLQTDGLSIVEQKPSLISQADVNEATVIFAIGCTLPATATASGKTANWDDVPDDLGYGPARDAIKRHIEELVDSLLKQRR
jgi:protein-tyrosine-phosphatase